MGILFILLSTIGQLKLILLIIKLSLRLIGEYYRLKILQILLLIQHSGQIYLED